jgi:hypothetical protein
MPEYSQQQVTGRSQVARGGSNSLRARLEDPIGIASRRTATNQEVGSQHVINTLASINPAIAAVVNALNDSNQPDSQTSAHTDEQWKSLVKQKYAPEDAQFATGIEAETQRTIAKPPSITTTFHPLIGFVTHDPNKQTIDYINEITGLLEGNEPSYRSSSIPPPPKPRSKTTTTYHPLLGFINHDSGE